MARLSFCSRSESKKTVVYMGQGMKVPEVTGIIPEASRSNPGQDEVRRKLDGGPLALIETIFSRDLGLGVKSQSRLEIAGSF